MSGLRRACADVSGGARPLGFVSKDQLDMSVVGVVFSTPPQTGFVPAPSKLSAQARDDGANGLVYMPDLTSPIGRRIMESMVKLSKVGESRPLLKVPGVRPAVIEGGRLALSAAVRHPDGSIKVLAPASAIGSAAQVVPAAPAPAAAPKVSQLSQGFGLSVMSPSPEPDPFAK